ncbi:hypothetical protein FACS189434_08500 [Bacteroidia bacterium]|nr:hypothetical protein FACS189434_08500 [Bacteroidia bacterium]
MNMKSIYKHTVKMSLLLIVLLNSTFAAAQSYNATAAANYADTWATNGTSQGSSYDGSDPYYHNPAYPRYTTPSGGGVDCANFVSQCLRAGGLDLRAGGGVVDSWGNIINCDYMHTFLRNYSYNGTGTNYARQTSGYPSWFTKGDVVLFGNSSDRWKHAAINVVTGTPALDAHTSNRYHRAVGYFYPSSSWSSADFYHIPATVPNTPPTITLTMPSSSIGNTTIHSGGSEQVLINVNNQGVGNSSNIEVIYMALSGEPQYTNDNETSAYYSGSEMKYNAYTTGNANQWYFTAQTPAAWDGKWVKIIAHNTLNGAWSTPKYVKVIPQSANVETLRPIITAPTNSIYTIPEYHIDDVINVSIDGRGYVGNGTWDAWDRNVSVIYACLSGNPQYTNSDENIYNNHKYGMYHTTTSNQYTFTPENASVWENRYVKIIAYNAQYSTWSEPRYIKIVPQTTTNGCTAATYGQYPSSTFTPSCTGSNETISSSCYAGEYSNVSVTNGTAYTFSSSNSSDFLTITNSSGAAVYAYGTGSVTWTATSTTTVRFYTHTNSSCGTSAASRSRIVKCGTTSTCKTPPEYDIAYTPDETWNSKDWGASITSSSACKVYKINGVSGATYNLHIDPSSSFNPVMVLYNSSGAQINTYDTGGNGSTEYHDYTFTSNGSIFVRVKAYGSTTGTFDFSVRKEPVTAPSNDQCANTTLSCGANLNGTTVGTTAKIGTVTSNSSPYGVWYSFLGDGQETTITSVAGSGFDHDMGIYSGSCSSLTHIITKDNSGSGGTETYTFTATSGTRYYVYVAYYSTSGIAAQTGTFSISRTCTANTYTITLDKQSGTGGNASVTATYNSAMPSATAPTRTGYTFGGYYTSTNGDGTQYYTALMSSARNWNLTSNTTLYAKWTANTYTVTLDKQSGAGGTSSVTATYGIAMPTNSVTAPTKTGYTFGGYYTGQNGTGTQYYTASMTSARNWDLTSNTTLYTKWTANTYTVTLDKQSGAGGTSSVTATYGIAMPTNSVTAPTKTGYTFGGYYTGQNGTGTQYYTASMTSAKNWDLTSNTTLYAKWTANTLSTYTITTSTDGNGVIDPSGSVSVNSGDSKTFYFYPKPGYEVNTVLIDGSDYIIGIGSLTEYTTISNVTSNHTIYVTFKQNTPSRVEDLQAQGISIFPNPTKDEIFIKSENEIEKIEVVDITGRTVGAYNYSPSQNGAINISALPAGVYLVKIFVDGQSITKKIIKE